MQASEERELLAVALHRRLGGARYQWDEQADALLAPGGVIDRIARERAAGELTGAAIDVDDGEFSSRESAATREAILRRAAALRATS